MSDVGDSINIEHLLVEAMHTMDVPLPDDPLPSAEEIAGARAAAAAAHSTCSAAALPSQPVKGLGGAGLDLKRKGGAKAGNSSTISAATAPPALVGGAGPARGGGRIAGAASNLANRPAAAAAAAEVVVGAESSPGVAMPDASSRGMNRDAAGVQSFRTAVTPDTADGNSSEWESASEGEADTNEAGADGAKAAVTDDSSTSWAGSISTMLGDFADPATLALCGVVLGACAGAVMVLGARVWLQSRQ